MLRLVYRMLAPLWQRLTGALQWRVLYWLNPKFIVGACVACTDDEGRVLLLQHRFWPPDSWGLPSGYIKRGETIEIGIRRELEEEIGAKVSGLQISQVRSGFRLRLEVLFHAHLESFGRADETEVLRARLFDLQDLPPGLLPAHREFLKSIEAQR